MSVGSIIDGLLGGHSLDQAEVRQLFGQLMAGEFQPEQVAGLLVAMRAKGETEAEVAGAAQAMREASVRISAPEGAVDLCGTGGDQSGTVNVSTAAAFVVAAAGIPVAKHGNRSVSSRSGSADVLEELGIPIDLTGADAENAIAEFNFAFLFAPNFHPAMKHAIGPRRALGIRTIFNLLGPLTNPAGVRRQIMGVFDRKWVEPLARVLHRLGAEHVLVVHSEDGLDEISLGSPTWTAELVDGQVRAAMLEPEELGFKTGSLADIAGGDAAHNARSILAALENIDNPLSQWIAANAAGGIRVAQDQDWADAIDLARETIRSGAARDLVDKLAS